MRGGNPEYGYLTAWCYGAPGIGLARLDTLHQLDDPETRAEIQAALETTVASGFNANHSLCHGSMGNLEFVQRAAQRLQSQRWQLQAELLQASLLESARQHG